MGPERYRLLEALGQGGNATVHRALAPDGREVALKLLDRLDPVAQARFEREVGLLRTLGAVRGLAPLLDYGLLEDGRPWLALPLYPGGTLRQRLERGPLSLEEARRTVAALAEALGQAHRLGVVHRDVKPENVLFDGAGRAVLVDFGLAKGHGAPSLSVTGQLQGSLGYMAPEQQRDAKHVAPPGDVFALGVLLYECLSGVLPPGGPAESVAALRALRPEVPAALAELVGRCLEPEPGRRPADGRELAALLAAPAPPRRTAAPILAGAVLLAGVLLAAALIYRSRSPEAPPAPASTPAEQAGALLERARERARATPLPWAEVAAAARAAREAGVAPDAPGLLELADRLGMDARERAAQPGPLDDTALAELAAAAELARGDPARAEAWTLERANVLMDRERLEELLALLGEGSLSGRVSREARLLIARARYFLGDEVGAAGVLDGLAREDPDGACGLIAASLRLGVEWRYGEAQEPARRALELEPEWHEAQGALALACLYGGRAPESRALIERALGARPARAGLERMLANALRRDDPQAALAALGRSLELTAPRTNPMTLRDRGWLRFALQDLEGARADFDRAVELATPGLREGDALIYRGVIRWAQGDEAGAREDWRESNRRSSGWFHRRMGDMPPALWWEMCDAAGVEMPARLRPRAPPRPGGR